jgi:hypothetical protein
VAMLETARVVGQAQGRGKNRLPRNFQKLWQPK